MGKRSLGIVKAGMKKPDPNRLARVLLTMVPPDASEADLVKAACLRWDDLATPFIGSVVERAEELRDGVGPCGTVHGCGEEDSDPEPEHEEEPVREVKNTPEVRAAAEKVTRTLIVNTPDMARREMFRVVCHDTGLDCTFGSWQTMYLYPAKKAVDAEKAVVEVQEEAAAKPPAESGGGSSSGSGSENGNGNGGREIYTESLQVLEAELAALDKRREVIRGAMWALERLVT